MQKARAGSPFISDASQKQKRQNVARQAENYAVMPGPVYHDLEQASSTHFSGRRAKTITLWRNARGVSIVNKVTTGSGRCTFK